MRIITENPQRTDTDRLVMRFNLLEKNVSDNHFALLRLLRQVFDRKTSRIIFNTLFYKNNDGRYHQKDLTETELGQLDVFITEQLTKKFSNLSDKRLKEYFEDNGFDSEIISKLFIYAKQADMILSKFKFFCKSLFSKHPVSNESSYVSFLAVKNKWLKTYEESTQILTKLIETVFPNNTNTFRLLSDVEYASPNFAKLILELSDKDNANGERYKLELLRHIMITLALLSLKDINHIYENAITMDSVSELIKTHFFEGKKGEVTQQNRYSVHDISTNHCIGVFKTKEFAQAYLDQEQHTDTHYIKEHPWSMRNHTKYGYVNLRIRRKTPYSTIRKMIFAGIKNKNLLPALRIGDTTRLVDTNGMMLVVPDELMIASESGPVTSDIDEKIMNEVIELLTQRYPKDKYPEAIIQLKHSVGTTLDRGQSDEVTWKRIIFYPGKDLKPIEIVVISEKNYMNYLYQVQTPSGDEGQAYALYDRVKSTGARDTLFKPELYGYSREDYDHFDTEKRKQIINELF